MISSRSWCVQVFAVDSELAGARLAAVLRRRFGVVMRIERCTSPVASHVVVETAHDERLADRLERVASEVPGYVGRLHRSLAEPPVTPPIAPRTAS